MEIWHCDPLVVEHVEDGIVYAKRTDLEFTPASEPLRGHVRALTPGIEGWQPELTIEQWMDAPLHAHPAIRTKPGRTLFGQDAEGNSFTWYIGHDAVVVLADAGLRL